MVKGTSIYCSECGSPHEIRRVYKDEVDSGKRGWKVTARSGAGAGYPNPPRWTLTAADVIAAGIDRYREAVRQWAAATLHAIHAADKEQK